jgi:hypothetical protein
MAKIFRTAALRLSSALPLGDLTPGETLSSVPFDAPSVSARYQPPSRAASGCQGIRARGGSGVEISKSLAPPTQVFEGQNPILGFAHDLDGGSFNSLG